MTTIYNIIGCSDMLNEIVHKVIGEGSSPAEMNHETTVDLATMRLVCEDWKTAVDTVSPNFFYNSDNCPFGKYGEWPAIRRSAAESGEYVDFTDITGPRYEYIKETIIAGANGDKEARQDAIGIIRWLQMELIDYLCWDEDLKEGAYLIIREALCGRPDFLEILAVAQLKGDIRTRVVLIPLPVYDGITTKLFGYAVHHCAYDFMKIIAGSRCPLPLWKATAKIQFPADITHDDMALDLVHDNGAKLTEDHVRELERLFGDIPDDCDDLNHKLVTCVRKFGWYFLMDRRPRLAMFVREANTYDSLPPYARYSDRCFSWRMDDDGEFGEYYAGSNIPGDDDYDQWYEYHMHHWYDSKGCDCEAGYPCHYKCGGWILDDGDIMVERYQWYKEDECLCRGGNGYESYCEWCCRQMNKARKNNGA